MKKKRVEHALDLRLDFERHRDSIEVKEKKLKEQTNRWI